MRFKRKNFLVEDPFYIHICLDIFVGVLGGVADMGGKQERRIT